MLERITARQREFVTRYAREYHTYEEWAGIFNVSINGVLKWKHKFAEEIEAEKSVVNTELKEKFDQIKDQAFEQLSKDLYCPDPKVRVAAWKYILDYAGYSGTKKIDMNRHEDTPFTPNEIAAIKDKILMIDTEKE